MDKPTLPAAAKFVDEVRTLFASGLEGAALWNRIEEKMRPLLADDGLKRAAEAWPATVESAPTVRNLQFYEDPDYGFTMAATVRQPDVITNLHDHGDKWTLYGLITGTETMHRFERTDGGDPDEGPAALKNLGAHEIGPGDIDVVPPGSIHQEHAGKTQSIALIVREAKSGTFIQHRYNADTGEDICHNGPGLMPMALNG